MALRSAAAKAKPAVKPQATSQAVGEKFDFSQQTIDELTYTSRITAKVDNTAIQAGYQLYHHAFLVTRDEKWAVIQQGISDQDRTARRYHWLSKTPRASWRNPITPSSGINVHVR